MSASPSWLPTKASTEEPCLPCKSEADFGGIAFLHTCKNRMDGSKNAQVLRDLVKYCQEHPEERFWQAIINWQKFPYIYGSMRQLNLKDKGDWLEDLFYQEELS